MRCEECLAVIEEYSYGELDEPASELVTAHLTACAECAEASEALAREQAIYALYQRDVELTPALWNGVRARIEAEKIVRPSSPPFTRLREWLAATLSGSQLFTPALVSAAVIVALGITAGMVGYLNTGPKETGTEVASRIESGQTPSPSTESVTADLPPVSEIPRSDAETGVDRDVTVASKIGGPKNNLDARSRGVTKVGPAARKRSTGSSSPLSGEHPEPEMVLALNDDFDDEIANQPLPVTANREDAEVARHLEKAQLLLRSFRNASFTEDEAGEDLSYEKQLSTRLLNENILLRRDAETRGSLPTEELLNSLEPFLLDIANLKDKPSPDDVRSIKERMQKKEIIAALHVY